MRYDIVIHARKLVLAEKNHKVYFFQPLCVNFSVIYFYLQLVSPIAERIQCVDIGFLFFVEES